jgi:hypothetical protein
MEIKQIETTGAVVFLTVDELLTITNALNEVCNGLDLPEFPIRMGVELAEAQALMKDVSALYDKIASHSDSTPLQSVK